MTGKETIPPDLLEKLLRIDESKHPLKHLLKTISAPNNKTFCDKCHTENVHFMAENKNQAFCFSICPDNKCRHLDYDKEQFSDYVSDSHGSLLDFLIDTLDTTDIAPIKDGIDAPK